MKSQKYDDDGYSCFWDKAPVNIYITQGTINHYAKLSDKDKYYEIIQQQNSYKFDIPIINFKFNYSTYRM